MDFEQLIKKRYSVRNFKPVPVSDEHLNKIIQAAMLAPTGCNYQPQRLLVLNSEESVSKLKNCSRCCFNAKTAILVCYNEKETWQRPYDGAKSAPVDAAIVATHMMLEAQNVGVGCCWVMHFKPDAIKQTYNLPNDVIPLALLVLGYPSDDSAPLKMHYESKPVDDVVVYNSF